MYKRFILILAGVVLLAGCGGGGGGGSAPVASTPAQVAEKTWVRAHLDDAYLWYNEIVDVPFTSYLAGPDYFDALLVRSRDRFSFSMPLGQATSQFQEGVESGFGVKWALTSNNRLYALYVDPHSPAAAVLTRGTEVTAINGQAVASLTNASLNSVLYPGLPDAPVNLTYRLPGTGTTQATALVSAAFATTVVSQTTIIVNAIGTKTGYLLFNEHLRTAEQQLISAMAYFKQQGVSELILDLRYNTGGYLSIAEEVASMVGGAAVQGKVFEKLRFNDKHPEMTNDPDNTILFSAQDSTNARLPQLGLNRLFVLTGSSTCSASESIINSLLPHIPVIRIGWTTCGKPYGSIQANYGQQAYFAIQMEGVNAAGQDDFKSGFTPTCRAYDDLNYPLGDTREACLNAALYYIDNNACPPMANVGLPKAVPSDAIPGMGDVRMLGQKPGLKLLR